MLGVELGFEHFWRGRALPIPTIITYDEINVRAHIYIEFERASIITKLTFVL
jgi:hypothetical protein